MAGFDNTVVFSAGERLSPSSAQDIIRMQESATSVARVNYTGNPEGNVSANPSSLCHDPVSGNIYFKQSGTGNTGWVLITSATSDVSIRPYVVGPTNSDFTDIGSAITQAVADGADASDPKIIYIKPNNGTPYAGGFSVPVGVSLVGMNVAIIGGEPQPIEVSGLITINNAQGETVSINNLYLMNPGANVINLQGGILELNNCGCDVDSTFYLINSTLPEVNSNGVLTYACVLEGAGGFINHLGDGAGNGVCTLSLRNTDFAFSETSIADANSGGFDIRFNANRFNSFPILLNTAPGGVPGFVDYCEFSSSNTFLTVAPGVTGSIQFGMSYVNFNASDLCDVPATFEVSFASIDCRQGFPTYTLGNGTPFGASHQVSPDDGIRWNDNRTGFQGSETYEKQGFVQTTDATVTTLASVSLAELESVTLKGTISAAQSDHTNMVGGDFMISARRASGGNVTLVGSVVTNVNSSSAATFTCDVDTGTQTVRVRVTGVAATTYNWGCSYSYQKILNNNQEII